MSRRQHCDLGGIHLLAAEIQLVWVIELKVQTEKNKHLCDLLTDEWQL